MSVTCLSIGYARVVYTWASSMRSKPTARPQSLMPPAMKARVVNSAVEPLAQLLLTLVIGMPVRPSS